MATAQQKQHVGIERKLRMRRALLEEAAAGAVYVPFCGDGDLAVELYGDRQVLAVDNDAARVATFHERLPTADAHLADADKIFPTWSDTLDPFAVADFDAFAYPYDAFRQFWKSAPKSRRLVLFFTDGERLGLQRQGAGRLPDGTRVRRLTTKERRPLTNFYWPRTVKPWFEAAIAPWTITSHSHYSRGQSRMLYWGAVIDAPTVDASTPQATAKAAPPMTLGPPTAEQIIQVEEALHEAAVSGNVPAMQLWLTNRAPDRWSSSGRMAPPSDEPDGASTDAAPSVDAAAALAELARQAQDAGA